MSRVSNEWLFVGALVLLGGAFLLHFPLPPRRDASPAGLFVALALTAVANLCLCNIAWRGGNWWRLTVSVTMVPAFFLWFAFLSCAAYF